MKLAPLTAGCSLALSTPAGAQVAECVDRYSASAALRAAMRTGSHTGLNGGA